MDIHYWGDLYVTIRRLMSSHDSKNKSSLTACLTIAEGHRAPQWLRTDAKRFRMMGY